VSNIVFRYDGFFSNTANRFQRIEYTLNGGTVWTPATVFEAGLSSTVWYNNRTLDLSAITGANNNSAFGVRVVSIFDPNGSNYVAVNGTYGTGGTMRFDAVTVSAGYVWTGAGGNTAITTPGNYQGGAAPTGTGTLLLGAAGGGNTTVATTPGLTLDQLLFQSGAPAYTITGTDTLTLNAGLVNNSTAQHTVSAPLFFGNQNTLFNAGTVTFTNDVRFTNNLTLQGTGTTVVNGAVLATSTGTLTVVSGTTLAGTGTINRPVTVAAGGVIRGGDPNGTAAQQVGVLTVVGATAINSTATANGVLRVQASRNTSTAQAGNSNADSSVLSVTGGGNLTIGSGTTKFTIDVVSGPTALQTSEAYTIQLAGVDAAVNLNVGGQSGANVTIDPARYTLTSSQFGFSGVSLFTNSSGTALYVSFTTTPVPEPGAILAIAVGVVGLGGYVRRRVRRGDAVQSA
jgi:hypothetical protein